MLVLMKKRVSRKHRKSSPTRRKLLKAPKFFWIHISILGVLLLTIVSFSFTKQTGVLGAQIAMLTTSGGLGGGSSNSTCRDDSAYQDVCQGNTYCQRTVTVNSCTKNVVTSFKCAGTDVHGKKLGKINGLCNYKATTCVTSNPYKYTPPDRIDPCGHPAVKNSSNTTYIGFPKGAIDDHRTVTLTKTTCTDNNGHKTYIIKLVSSKLNPGTCFDNDYDPLNKNDSIKLSADKIINYQVSNYMCQQGYSIPKISFNFKTNYYLTDGDVHGFSVIIDKPYHDEDYPQLSGVGYVFKGETILNNSVKIGNQVSFHIHDNGPTFEGTGSTNSRDIFPIEKLEGTPINSNEVSIKVPGC